MLVSRLYAKASGGLRDRHGHSQDRGVLGDSWGLRGEDGRDGDVRREKDLESVKQEQKGMFHRLSYLYQKVCTVHIHAHTYVVQQKRMFHRLSYLHQKVYTSPRVCMYVSLKQSSPRHKVQ
jgi:hypothetical protein